MGLSCPHTCWKCFRILDPPPLHPPPSSLVVHWLRTSWPLSPYNFTNLGLCLENFLKNCFSPCPSLSLQLCALVSGMGTLLGQEGKGHRGHQALTDVVEASRSQALRQMRGVEERGQEGHGHVILMVQAGFVLCTLPREQE